MTKVRSMFQKGDWVKVALRGRQLVQEYLGKILALDDEDAQITFLRDRGSFYTFPNVEDISWVSLEQIVCKLGHLRQKSIYF